MRDPIPDMGACCNCGGTARVRTIVLLPLRAPVPGTGWGCGVCNLPPDGAMAVLCDNCVRRGDNPQFAISGYVSSNSRVPIDSLSLEPFVHSHGNN